MKPAPAMSQKEARAICGSLSSTSKMPGPSYSLPTQYCRTGGLLQQIPGTVCSCCYAVRGRYAFLKVRNAMAKRIASIVDPRWVAAMISLICHSQGRYFRWHDSGDIQNIRHLENIVAVAKNLPQVRFWLPTREYQTVEAYRRSGGKIPPNLCIRYSAHLVDGRPPLGYGMPTSSVSSHPRKTPPNAYRCPAARNGNICGSCRACWDRTVKIVDFPLKAGRRLTGCVP